MEINFPSSSCLSNTETNQSSQTQHSTEIPISEQKSIQVLRKDTFSSCGPLNEILSPETWKVYSSIDERNRPDESILALFIKADVPFLLNSTKFTKVVAKKSHPKSQIKVNTNRSKPTKKVTIAKSVPLKPTKKKRPKISEQVIEFKKPKKVVPLPPPDPNAAPLRRSSRQRSRTYLHRLDEYGNTREENEEEKYEKMAADIPEFRDYKSEPEERIFDELIIDPIKASEISEAKMFQYIGACEAKTGANPYMIMMHLSENNYDIKKAVETIDLPETKFQIDLKKLSWNADDIAIFNKAMSIRKNYKAMSQLAKKMPSKTKLYSDIVTVYYALKKKLCSTGKYFQICENMMKKDVIDLGFKYVASGDCVNCKNELSENNENELSLCSVCYLYKELYNTHRPNAAPTQPLFDLSGLDHSESSCRFQKLWTYDYGLDEPDLTILQHNLYCVRGHDLLTFFAAIKDNYRISKKARSILRVKQGLDMNEYFVFSTSMKLHNENIDEKKAPFGVYAFDAKGYANIDCFDLSSNSIYVKNEFKKSSSVPVDFEFKSYNINTCLKKLEDEDLESGFASQQERSGSLETELIEPDEDKSNDNQNEKVLEEKKTINEVVENIQPLAIVSPNDREELSPELDKVDEMLNKEDVTSNINGDNLESSSKSNDIELKEESDTWKVFNNQKITTVNEEGDVISQLEVKPNLSPKIKPDEYDVYYLGKVTSEGTIQYEYGYDFYMVYQRRLMKIKPIQCNGITIKKGKKKLIEGKTPKEWLEEIPLNKTCLEFVNDFRACKRKFSNLADKYGVPIAVVRSFYFINNAHNGLQRIFAATDKLKNRRGRKGRKPEVKVKRKPCEVVNCEPEMHDNYVAAFNDVI